MRNTWFHRLSLFGVILTFGVVVLGAYVRLSDAGLGCPDWAGCYGRIVVPQSQQAIAQANTYYPDRALEAPKAWKEMIHRYFAGTLGIVILMLAILAIRHRDLPEQPVALPLALLGLVIFQALLGMLTVTWLLKPVIVMGHLLGGLATLAVMTWLCLRTGNYFLQPQALQRQYDAFRALAAVGLLLLVLQIALGGWTSSNYAALACPDFPTCQGRWWPPMDFVHGFKLWHPLGINHEGGILDSAARTAIHVTHRLGALVVFLYLSSLAILLGSRSTGWLRAGSMALAAALLLQIGIGISVVLEHLPLPLAVAHNAGAALLLLTLLTLNHILRPKVSHV
jgi:cytochrome c oxidase assembly protein subunit 15